MKHSIALVTGTAAGVGYAAASMLAAVGWREIIVTGRSLAQVQETAAELEAKTTKVFTHHRLQGCSGLRLTTGKWIRK